jgi:release factor glutamine methyltransferase
VSTAHWIERATARLSAASETPRLDAELILAHELGLTRAALLARLRERLVETPRLETLLARRERGEPLAYLFGRGEFYSMEFEVEPPALVPRPETEHLVETVLEFIRSRPVRVLDLCTGTGCVASAIASNAPASSVVAADIEPRFVSLARRNAAWHGLSARVECVKSDLFSALKHRETFDVICANPPYIAEAEWESLPRTVRDYEDPTALRAGPDGLDIVRKIVAQASRFLRPGGLLALEIGAGQAVQTRRLFGESAYDDVQTVRDLAGIERIVNGFAPARLGSAVEAAQENEREARLNSWEDVKP